MRPIDADELRKKAVPHYYSNCIYAVPISAIDEAPTIEQSTWISVDERLPLEGASIEMFFPITPTICLGYYKKIATAAFWCVNFPDGTGRVADNKPTHWRYRYIAETPRPPKGE